MGEKGARIAQFGESQFPKGISDKSSVKQPLPAEEHGIELEISFAEQDKREEDISGGQKTHCHASVSYRTDD
jgi:hypothetical protein